MKPEILFEDSQIIVCVKPAGIATQNNRIGSPDMVSILKNHLAATSKKQPYLAVIHRLDQPVSGLLVFAKTPAAAKELNRQLQSDGFGKYYHAWLSAIPDKDENDLTDYLIKDGRTNTSRICSADTPGAKKAELHYRILKKISDCCLAEVTLKTGRHHQIRVQMANMHCPIIGDRKYGAAADIPQEVLENLPSQNNLQLYACRLVFRHPQTKKEMVFEL